MYAGSFAILIVSRILMGKNPFVYVLICLLVFKEKLLFLLQYLLKHPEAIKLGGSVVQVWFFSGNISFERWC